MQSRGFQYLKPCDVVLPRALKNNPRLKTFQASRKIGLQKCISPLYKSNKPPRRHDSHPQQNRNAARHLRAHRQHATLVPLCRIAPHDPLKNQRLHSRKKYQHHLQAKRRVHINFHCFRRKQHRARHHLHRKSQPRPRQQSRTQLAHSRPLHRQSQQPQIKHSNRPYQRRHSQQMHRLNHRK